MIVTPGRVPVISRGFTRGRLGIVMHFHARGQWSTLDIVRYCAVLWDIVRQSSSASFRLTEGPVNEVNIWTLMRSNQWQLGAANCLLRITVAPITAPNPCQHMLWSMLEVLSLNGIEWCCNCCILKAVNDFLKDPQTLALTVPNFCQHMSLIQTTRCCKYCISKSVNDFRDTRSWKKFHLMKLEN